MCSAFNKDWQSYFAFHPLAGCNEGCLQPYIALETKSKKKKSFENFETIKVQKILLRALSKMTTRTWINYRTVGCRRTVCRRTARLEFHLKIRTTPGWKNELRTISPHANSVCCEDYFFGVIADFKTTPFRRFKTFQPHPPHVCTLQAYRHDSQTDWKIRTRLAEVVKNKNDPACRQAGTVYPPFFGTRQCCNIVHYNKWPFCCNGDAHPQAHVSILQSHRMWLRWFRIRKRRVELAYSARWRGMRNLNRELISQ